MTDFEQMLNIFKKFPKVNPKTNEEQWDYVMFEDGNKIIYIETGNEYCVGTLYFDKNGNFQGFMNKELW